MVDLDRAPEAAEVRRWLLEHGVETLNVAGPRESQSPGIEALAKEFILRVCGHVYCHNDGSKTLAVRRIL